MEKTTVLICDDSPAVHESLSIYFNNAGIQTISAYDGSYIMELLKKHDISLVILDIMLPGKSGTKICQEIRQKSDVPILFLSAKGDEDDRVGGLLLGADDYVTKPFSPREVTARVLSILKRTRQKVPEDTVIFTNLILYPSSCKAVIDNTPLSLTPKEFFVLKCLVDRPGVVISRDLILDEVWGSNYFGDTRAVDTIVKRLRAKLDAGGAQVTIQSVYGVGYKIESDIINEETTEQKK
ncbi:MAG: response regulator transcription factor [Lachnospiraceae bacterium]|nr:response regulator transcription factor [Lachnospiraceae bacterium]